MKISRISLIFLAFYIFHPGFIFSMGGLKMADDLNKELIYFGEIFKKDNKLRPYQIQAGFGALGYAQGIMDALIYTKQICPPAPGINGRQLRYLVTSYYNENVEGKEWTARMLVSIPLLNLFPCD